MTLTPFASTLLVLWYVAGSIAGTIGLVLLGLALRSMDRRLADLETRLSPLIERTESVLSDVESRVQTVGDTTARILSSTESTVATVETTAQKSTQLATKALHYPLVEINAITYGVIAGVTTLLKTQSKSSEGDSK